MSTGVYILKNIHFFLFLFLISTLIACGSVNTPFSEIENFEACFIKYNTEEELANKLNQLQPELEAEKPLPYYMVLAGCFNYQLGNAPLAELLLKRAIEEPVESSSDYSKYTVKGTAASALGLIYIRKGEKEKINPYIKHATNHSLGRWMLTFYYLEHYRESGHTEHLISAINQIKNKIQAEGTSTLTELMLAEMSHVKKLEELCGNVNPEADTASCEPMTLKGRKIYLESVSYGLLHRFLKVPPHNTPNKIEDENNNTSEEAVAVSST